MDTRLVDLAVLGWEAPAWEALEWATLVDMATLLGWGWDTPLDLAALGWVTLAVMAILEDSAVRLAWEALEWDTPVDLVAPLDTAAIRVA